MITGGMIPVVIRCMTRMTRNARVPVYCSVMAVKRPHRSVSEDAGDKPYREKTVKHCNSIHNSRGTPESVGETRNPLESDCPAKIRHGNPGYNPVHASGAGFRPAEVLYRQSALILVSRKLAVPVRQATPAVVGTTSMPDRPAAVHASARPACVRRPGREPGHQLTIYRQSPAPGSALPVGAHDARP